MATGKYTLLVDWNADGDYSDSNEDITGDTLSISWERGRDYASQLSGRSIAGVLTAILDNDDGKYSPSNSSSALDGLIKPGRPVQLQAGSGSFPYTFPLVFDDKPIWTGRLERIRPDPSSVDRKTATLTAFGVLGFLNAYQPSIATQEDKRTDEVIGTILDDVGWPSGDRDLATGQTTLTRFWVDGKSTIDALRIPEETEAGFIKETRDGKVGFESRHTRLASPYTTSQATFSDASGAANTYVEVAQDDPLDTVVNHFEAVIGSIFTTASIAVLWTLPETGASSPLLAPGEAKTFEAQYPTENSANTAREVDVWTTPAATTDVLGNSASNGSGTNLTSSIGIAATKTAERMVITLTNNHATSAAYVTKLQARGTAVSASDPVTMRAIDSSSQTTFGERRFRADTTFIPTTTEGQSWCDYQLAIYASPVEIISLSVEANGSDGNLYEALTRDISDRVTVVATGDSGLGLSADFFVEHESHTVEPGPVHRLTWQLSPASGGYSQFWVLDKSKLGETTVPAY
jgi:hypothetical protein